MKRRITKIIRHYASGRYDQVKLVYELIDNHYYSGSLLSRDRETKKWELDSFTSAEYRSDAHHRIYSTYDTNMYFDLMIKLNDYEGESTNLADRIPSQDTKHIYRMEKSDASHCNHPRRCNVITRLNSNYVLMRMYRYDATEDSWKMMSDIRTSIDSSNIASRKYGTDQYLDLMKDYENYKDMNSELASKLGI